MCETEGGIVTMEAACAKIIKSGVCIARIFDFEDMWVFDVCGPNGEELTIGSMPAIIKATGEETDVFPPDVMSRLAQAAKPKVPKKYKPARMPRD
ncbi:MAG: hypothetical protein NC311_10580 [Muribaculaceae bacterium]|nr:hypothetical protein [Muribaculaceae bacterium]